MWPDPTSIYIDWLLLLVPVSGDVTFSCALLTEDKRSLWVINDTKQTDGPHNKTSISRPICQPALRCVQSGREAERCRRNNTFQWVCSHLRAAPSGKSNYCHFLRNAASQRAASYLNGPLLSGRNASWPRRVVRCPLASRTEHASRALLCWKKMKQTSRTYAWQLS